MAIKIIIGTGLGCAIGWLVGMALLPYPLQDQPQDAAPVFVSSSIEVDSQAFTDN